MKRKLLIFSILITLIYSIILLLYLKNNRTEYYSDRVNHYNLKYSKAELALFHADYEFMKIRNPYTNSIPENARQRELDFVKDLPSRELIGNKNNNSLLSQNWISMGPRNVSGRMLSIEFDINNENIIQAGSASGGIWKSIDRGLSWVRTSSPNEIQSVTCIEQDTRTGKNNIWYYGTGELLSTTDRRITTSIRTIGLGNGIYKSIDNGSTWQPLTSTQIAATGWLSEVFHGVWNIQVDKNQSSEDIIYAACYGAIMRSSDGGNSWTKVLGDLDKKSFSTDIVISSNGIKYAALSTFTTSGKTPKVTGIWKSPNGIDWINITPSNFPEDIRVIKLALAPSNQDILYVVTEVPQYSKSVQAWLPSYHGFWKYAYNPSSGEGTWDKRSNNLPGKGTDNIDDNSLNTLGGYALAVKVKPDDENVIFLGGTSLFRTTNGFSDSTTNMNIGGYPYYWTDRELHPDIHDIAFLPSNPNVLYTANDGGIQVTDNCLNNEMEWRYLTNGLITTQFYSISIDHNGFHDSLFFGGLQDNASQVLNSKDPYQPWKLIYGGDGMSSAVSNNGDFLIGSIYFGSLFTTDREGKNYTEQTPSFLNWSNFSFYTYFTLDQDDSKTLYLAAKNKIWRKDDISLSAFDKSQVDIGWNEISNEKISSSAYVTALEADSSRLYIGTSNGRVYRLDGPRSNDNTPFEITGDEFPYYGFVSCIEMDPDDSDKAFVVFSNYSVLSIFYTTDGGISWTRQGGNLEGDPDAGTLGPSIRYIKILRYKGSTIYFAGTSTGLYSTNTLAGSNTVWMKEAADLIGNVIVDFIDARSSDGLVAVATQGSGIYTAYFSTTGNKFETKDIYFTLSQNYPNPASGNTEIKFSLEKEGLSQMNLYDMNGNYLKNVINKFMPCGNHNIKLNVSDLESGNYFYVLESGNKKQTRKLIVLQ